jgi:hypothetical protein
MEVLLLAKKTPAGKATGPDEMPVEVLRLPCVAAQVTRIMNQVLTGTPAPTEWKTANIVAIPKKAGASKIEDHRGISLMSCAAKLFNRVLLQRLQPVLDPFIRPEQNGFRPNRGTVPQILALRRVLEEARIHQVDLVCVFVDFRKAFDTVSRRAIPFILNAYNVPKFLINAVMSRWDSLPTECRTPLKRHPASSKVTPSLHSSSS